VTAVSSLRVLQIVPLVTEDGAYGGPVTSALTHAAELRRRGMDVVMVGPGLRSGERDGVRLFRVIRLLPHRFAGLVSPGLAFWVWRHAQRFDVVHVHTGRDLATLLAALACRMRGVPFVAQTHGMVARDPRRAVVWYDALLTRPALSRADALLVLTPGEAERVGEILSPPSVVIGNGVPEPAHQWRPGAPPVVLFVGRLHSVKQPQVFVAAAADVLGKGIRATFVLCGPEGGMGPEVSEAIGRSGFADSIRCIGARKHEEVIAELAAASVFVLPSRSEVFPMSLVEALSVGVPSVVTEGCELAPTLGRAEAAIVVEPTAAAVAAAVRTLLTDNAAARRMHDAAVALARSEFSVEAVGTKLVGSYERAAATRSSRRAAR
jgi:glycosyltransferase involved in cell wall biosynthesis